MMTYQPEPGIFVWMTNPDIHTLSPRVFSAFDEITRVIFLGFGLDVNLVEEAVLLRDLVPIEIYDNTLPLDHDTPEYHTVMEFADDLEAEGDVTLHLYEELRVPALLAGITSGSFRTAGTLIIVNDGFVDDDDGGWYDSEMVMNALFALFQGLGYTYDGMRADAEILSHRELAKTQGVDLEFEVTDTGWLIDGVISECLDMCSEGHFHHLLGSLLEGIVELLRGAPHARSRLECFINAVAFDPYDLGEVAEA